MGRALPASAKETKKNPRIKWLENYENHKPPFLYPRGYRNFFSLEAPKSAWKALVAPFTVTNTSIHFNDLSLQPWAPLLFHAKVGFKTHTPLLRLWPLLSCTKTKLQKY